MPPREEERPMLDDTFMIPSGALLSFRRRRPRSSTSLASDEDGSSLSNHNNNNNSHHATSAAATMYANFLTTATYTRINEKERFTPWIQRIWELHFALSLTVLLLGISSNSQSSKYIPIEPTQLEQGCNRAFLNTLALSAQDPNALACCKPGSALLELCDKITLPLAGRLSRFPEAWLLPLMPWFLRWFLIIGKTNARRNSIYMWRRLGLYLAVMCVRGFVLYYGMNRVEGYLRTPSESGSCWYQNWLRPDQATCYGRPFDFSDHVVLYFAQLVPIGLMETLDILFTKSIPDLIRRVSSGLSLTDVENDPRYSTTTTKHQEQQQRQQHPERGQHKRTTVIALVLVYLYSITLWSAHRTAAYFHTAGEVLAGYAVSLLVQLPLYYIVTQSASAQRLRVWFFGAAAATAPSSYASF